jgi:hypothetical protein
MSERESSKAALLSLSILADPCYIPAASRRSCTVDSVPLRVRGIDSAVRSGRAHSHSNDESTRSVPRRRRRCGGTSSDRRAGSDRH